LTKLSLDEMPISPDESQAEALREETEEACWCWRLPFPGNASACLMAWSSLPQRQARL